MNVLEELEMCARSEQPLSAEFLLDVIKRTHAALREARAEVADAGAHANVGGCYEWLRINDPDTFFAEMSLYRPGVVTMPMVFVIPELGEVQLSWGKLRGWIATHMILHARTNAEAVNWSRYLLQ